MNEQQIERIVRKAITNKLAAKSNNVNSRIKSDDTYVNAVADGLATAISALNSLRGGAKDSTAKKVWENYINQIVKILNDFDEATGYTG